MQINEEIRRRIHLTFDHRRNPLRIGAVHAAGKLSVQVFAILRHNLPHGTVKSARIKQRQQDDLSAQAVQIERAAQALCSEDADCIHSRARPR